MTIVDPVLGGGGGAIGDNGLFESIAARDTFFATAGNETRLRNGLPVVVNEGTAATTFTWTGADSPSTYDPDLFIEHPLNTGPGTLFMGLDGANLSSAGEGVNFKTAYGDKAIAIGTLFNAGSIKPFSYYFTKSDPFVVADVFDTQLSDPQGFNFLTVSTTYTESLNVRPATTGILRVRGYAGIDNTASILEDTRITITAGDIGNIVNVPITGILVRPGTNIFLEFSGVDLFGGLQTSGDFSGQTKAFLQSVIHTLTPTRFLDKNDLDQYALLNSDYTTAAEKTAGIAVNEAPTATADTFTAADFVPGVAASSNPTLKTDGSNTFAADDIIIIVRGTAFVDNDLNDGIYEVESHIGTTLTVRGVGTSAKTEDAVKEQFVSLTSTGTITKTTISVLRANGAGGWEIGSGSTTPIIYATVQTGTGIFTGTAAEIAALSSPADGLMAYNTGNNFLYQYDGSRAKWLTVDTTTYQFGSNGTTDNTELNFNSTQNSTSGVLIPRDGTIISVTGMQNSGNSTKGFEVRATGVSIFAYALAADQFISNAVDADFVAGDVMHVFAVGAGAGANNPTSTVTVKWGL